MERRYLPQDLIDRMRLDADETIIFEHQLRQLLSKTYDQKYTDLRARAIVPRFNESINPNARTFTYRKFDAVGTYAVIHGYSQNLPRVGLKATEHTAKTRWIGASYGFSEQDLREAQFAGQDLRGDEARVARKVIEEGLDYLIAFGLSDHGIPGFLNHPNVTASTVPTVGSDTTWEEKAATDPELIIADILDMYNDVCTTTAEVEKPNALALPETSKRLLEQTLYSTDRSTVMDELRRRLPQITKIEGWYRLETAGSGSVKRAVMYKDDGGESVGYVIPEEFKQHEVFRETWNSWVVPCTAKTGGVVAPYPLTMQYRDGM